jgi:hypothetical protein
LPPQRSSKSQSAEDVFSFVAHFNGCPMTNSVKFRPHPGADLVQTSAPMLRAYQTVAAYQVEHGEIGQTKSGAWNRHCIDWVVRRMDFPNWTAEKLYSVNKVLDEYDVPPLEYLRVLLTSLRLGRKMGGAWRLTKPGMVLAGDPEAAYATIAPAFLFRFDHSEGMRTGQAPAGDWELWLQAINRMPQDGFTLPELANFLYGPSAGGGWRGSAGGLFSAVAMPLEWVGLLTRTGSGGIDEMLWRTTPLWAAGLEFQRQTKATNVVPFPSRG